MSSKKQKVLARLTEHNGEPLLNEGIIQNLFQNKDFLFIREWLEQNGMDRHMMLELKSTEIAIVTPWGVMMEVRTADDGKLGLCGGVVQKNETVLECAVREMEEELGLKADPMAMQFVEDDVHTHEYANGDKALFHCFRFVYQLEEIPEELTFNYESTGVEIVKNLRDDILKNQRDFVSRCIQKYCRG